MGKWLWRNYTAIYSLILRLSISSQVISRPWNIESGILEQIFCGSTSCSDMTSNSYQYHHALNVDSNSCPTLIGVDLNSYCDNLLLLLFAAVHFTRSHYLFQQVPKSQYFSEKFAECRHQALKFDQVIVTVGIILWTHHFRKKPAKSGNLPRMWNLLIATFSEHLQCIKQNVKRSALQKTLSSVLNINHYSQYCSCKAPHAETLFSSKNLKLDPYLL